MGEGPRPLRTRDVSFAAMAGNIGMMKRAGLKDAIRPTRSLRHQRNHSAECAGEAHGTDHPPVSPSPSSEGVSNVDPSLSKTRVAQQKGERELKGVDFS